MRAIRSIRRSPGARHCFLAVTWLLLAALTLGPVQPAAAQVWDTIPPADLQAIGLAAFDDSEIDLPYYVANFHKLATAVEPEDPNRGFIRASVWQDAKDNQPSNARVMENILSLAFFYSQKRPWNPWYGSQQLRHRLEAALSYWMHMQSPEGTFSENGEQQGSLSATASATKFMGETLHYIKEGPPINEDLLRQVAQAQRKAIFAVLYGAEFYEQGKRSSSEYSGVWAGALSYLALYPDQEIRSTLETRMRSSMRDFQSPLGYFYDGGGPDMGDSLRTHFSNLRMAWHYAQGTGLESYFIDMMKEYYVWLVWNVSIEKDRSGYYLNAAINTQGERSFLSMDDGMPYRNGLALADTVRLARAFQLDETARAKWAADERKRLAAAWPRVPELEVGNPDAYSPETFLHRRHSLGVVSQELHREALTALPCADSHPFNHIKQDGQSNSLFYYANRPGGYYLIFAAGESVRPQQSLGITLIRSHSDGTVLLSQPGNASLAWGTRPAGSEDVYESTRIFPAFRSGTQDISVKVGPNSLPEGDVVLSYAIGQGSKIITLSKDRIDVEVRHPGDFTEQIPLLIPDNDRVDQRGDASSKGKFRLEHRGVTATLGEAKDVEGPRKIQPLLLQGRDVLRYTIRF
ncbi:MAG: hypothetical protein KIT83_21900 [Bryobacterales bacterium]|nr:hypothetical protein [Bryobacterales bacterium]